MLLFLTTNMAAVTSLANQQYFSFSIFNLSTTTVVIDSLQLTFPLDAAVFVGVSLIGSNATCFGRKNDRDYSGRLISILQNRWLLPR